MCFYCVGFLFFNVWWDFADVPFEREAFSFLFLFLAREDQLLYRRHTNPIYFLSATAKRVLSCVKGPHYLPHVSAVLRNSFLNIFSLRHSKSMICDTASY